MKQVASLRYGVIFTAFVQDLLGITLEIDHIETEKSLTPIRWYRFIRPPYYKKASAV